MVGHKDMDAQGGANNPNSLGRGCRFPAGTAGYVFAPREVTGQRVRARAQSFADHYSQASMFWESMSPVEQGRQHRGSVLLLSSASAGTKRSRTGCWRTWPTCPSGLVEHIAGQARQTRPSEWPDRRGDRDRTGSDWRRWGRPTAQDPYVALNLTEAYRHSKTIAAWGARRQVLDAAGIAAASPGVLTAGTPGRCSDWL